MGPHSLAPSAEHLKLEPRALFKTSSLLSKVGSPGPVITHPTPSSQISLHLLRLPLKP